MSSATVKNSNLQSVRGGVTTEIAFKRSVYIQGLKTNSRLRFSLYVHFCVDLNWFLRSSYRLLSSLILAKQQPPFDLRVPHERVILQKLEKDLFALVVVPLLSNSLLSNLCTNFYALTMPTPCQSSEQISFLKHTIFWFTDPNAWINVSCLSRKVILIYCWAVWTFSAVYIVLLLQRIILSFSISV